VLAPDWAFSFMPRFSKVLAEPMGDGRKDHLFFELPEPEGVLAPDLGGLKLASYGLGFGLRCSRDVAWSFSGTLVYVCC
jgi:hypothetical protein